MVDRRGDLPGYKAPSWTRFGGSTRSTLTAPNITGTDAKYRAGTDRPRHVELAMSKTAGKASKEAKKNAWPDSKPYLLPCSHATSCANWLLQICVTAQTSCVCGKRQRPEIPKDAQDAQDG